MKANLDIEKLVGKGISNEMDYERAMVADRKLRLLAKESTHFKNLRAKLRLAIEEYEAKEWSDVNQLTESKLLESEKSERIADFERVFIEKRKQAIKVKLKELDLTQENLAFILGHKSKTHMSELVNGIKPFTLKDLVIINQVLKINLECLVPTVLSRDDQMRIKEAVETLDKPKVQLSS